jgi:hypothetical protein
VDRFRRRKPMGGVKSLKRLESLFEKGWEFPPAGRA